MYTYLQSFTFAAMADRELFKASARGDVSEVRRLLAAGAQPDGYKDRGDSTALHQAATHGHTGVVQELLAHGADIHAVNKAWNTPLYHPARRGFEEIVHLLLQRGAKLEGPTKRIDTALHAACDGGHLTIVKLMVEEYGGERLLAVRTYINYQTPLEKANANGHTAVVEYLRQVEARIYKGEKSEVGRSPPTGKYSQGRKYNQLAHHTQLVKREVR